ncbi:helix-turn-helix domain-containing protein [Salibacterium halotolerans]|uniref:DNA binding domain-containing protein, excisionase family n=1 Tax=Salibacterium halotolerans TaxID=1884432 RepID=A0A1I5Y217_9BACI|nr:helix-turn-helix domain-containing protein [Salibacterium halotolerans]SFQ38233.1 DNA binding domain-containing protein, excisionase family [Salibacterium halotolerans]
MTSRHTIKSIDLLQSVRTLIKAGEPEEAHRILHVFYAQLKSEVEDRHVAPMMSRSHDFFTMTEEDEKELRAYYSKIAETDSVHEKKRYFHFLKESLKRMTGDDSFIKAKYKMKSPVLTKRGRKPSGVRLSPSAISLRRKRGTSERLSANAQPNRYSTGEAAEILGVSSETVRKMCDAGRFPEAERTNGGHWRIPDTYFKVTLQEAREADQFMKPLDEKTVDQLGGYADDIDISRT